MSTIWKTPEKAVPSLLVRVRKAKEHALGVVADGDGGTVASNFEGIESMLQHMNDYSLLQKKNWEMMMVEQLGVLDQALDDELFSFEYPESRAGDKLKLIETAVGKLKSLISMVDHQLMSPPPSINQPLVDDKEVRSIAAEDKVMEKSKAVPLVSECFHCLGSSQLKMCLVLLSVFPENKAIKKRPLLYWWIGEGLVTEEVGEQIFQELLNHNIIKPISRNSFTVYPSVREVLIQLAQKNSLLKFSEQAEAEAAPQNACGRAFLLQGNGQSHTNMDAEVVTIFNMTEKYLGNSPDLLSRPRKLKVLQMGRWQDSATHHIEAEDYEKLFERLGSQKHLTYLSLRGISRIETLPRSIRKLTSLLILDLRACHNLNKLPEQVAELRSLTHLDVSECYLLDSMPNGLERLTRLQVLKGFVVSGSCNISDLSGLTQLRKLSIRVGSLGKEQLRSLGTGFKALRNLTLLWSEASPDGDTVASLPETLIKLDLWSVPFDVVPPWMQPSKVPNLEKLYIKGGKLNSLNNYEYASVKILRLNYLKNLKINQEDLLVLFPGYRYLQRTNCHEHDPNLDLTRDE